MKRVILCLDGTWNNDAAPATRTNVFKLHHAIAKTDDKGIQQASAVHRRHCLDPGRDGAIPERCDRLRHRGADQGSLRAARRELRSRRRNFSFRILARRLRGAQPGRLHHPLRRCQSNRGLSLSTRRGRSIARRLDDATRPCWPSFAPRRTIPCASSASACGTRSETSAIRSTRVASSAACSSSTTLRLADTIDVALHALAIDEMRGPFRPSLWSMPRGQTLPEHQHVEQVWFAGSHCDVGGGFRETALSDVALLWMAERVTATTGLAFDKDVLAGLARPDPLGAQHLSATGSIFRWSKVFPFIRLVKQAVAAIPPLRRMLIGTWRTGKLPRGQVVVNESIHDSVVQRFGQKVIELRDGRSHMITYRPRNLVPVAPEPRAPGRESRRRPETAKGQGLHGPRHVRSWRRLGQLGGRGRQEQEDPSLHQPAEPAATRARRGAR